MHHARYWPPLCTSFGRYFVCFTLLSAKCESEGGRDPHTQQVAFFWYRKNILDQNNTCKNSHITAYTCAVQRSPRTISMHT
jgi:hypothetical protein